MSSQKRLNVGSIIIIAIKMIETSITQAASDAVLRKTTGADEGGTTIEGARILPQTHRLDRHLLPKSGGDLHRHTEDASLRSLPETGPCHHMDEGHRRLTGKNEDHHPHTESAGLPLLPESDLLHHTTEGGLPPNIVTDVPHHTAGPDPHKWNVTVIAVSSIARAGIIFSGETLHRRGVISQ